MPLEVVDSPESSNQLTAARVLLAFVAVALIVWLCTGFYSVSASEVALVERMGQLVGTVDHQGVRHATVVPTGLHYGLPWPLDIVHKIPSSQSLVIDIKDFSTAPLEYQQYKNVLMQQGIPKSAVDAVFDPYLITSDKNVLHASITVQYRVQDPEEYFMSAAHSDSLKQATLVADREAVLRKVALHALIRCMADTTIDEALYQGRQDLVNRLTALTQKEAKELKLGVSIDRVNVPEVRWPANLDDVFNLANQAHAQAEQTKLNAQQYAESLKTNTQTGVVAQILSDAQSYQGKVVKGAMGEAERFKLVYARYQAAPDLTRLSIYADTMDAIFANVTRTIFVQKGQKAWLPLDPIEGKLPNPTTPANNSQLGAPAAVNSAGVPQAPPGH